MTLPDIRSIHVAGKYILVRAGLNVPIKNGWIVNDFRIRKSLATLRWLQTQKAKVLIIAHIGREPTDSLKPVYKELSKHIKVSFCEDLTSQASLRTVRDMEDGEIVLFENLRKFPGEVENDERFAQELASFANIYVNDAFSASHREHASIVGVPKYLPHHAGVNLIEEVGQLRKAFRPQHPSLAILAGAKFETKLSLINKIIPDYDYVYIGGALANDFYKAQGFEIGRSLVSRDVSGLRELLKNEKIMLPPDVIVKKDGEVSVKKPSEVTADEMIVDAGPETAQMISELAPKMKFILWNGPLGRYEDGFEEQTGKVAQAVANSKAMSIVGGGDSVAVVSKLGLENSFTLVSTGGGAMMQFISEETLPGIEALLHPHTYSPAA